MQILKKSANEHFLSDILFKMIQMFIVIKIVKYIDIFNVSNMIVEY